MDDPQKKELDGKLISLTEEHEVRYWTGALNVSRETLERAVGEVGNSAAKVRDWIIEKAQGSGS